MDVSVEFSVYKNPYNSCCQMSFSLSEYTNTMSAGALHVYGSLQRFLMPLAG